MDVTTVALYMRLSKEDNDVRDESNSITNQRKLLLGFMKKKQEFADSSIAQYIEMKIAYLIQRARIEYGRKGRNKGFRHT